MRVYLPFCGAVIYVSYYFSHSDVHTLRLYTCKEKLRKTRDKFSLNIRQISTHMMWFYCSVFLCVVSYLSYFSCISESRRLGWAQRCAHSVGYAVLLIPLYDVSHEHQTLRIIDVCVRACVCVCSTVAKLCVLHDLRFQVIEWSFVEQLYLARALTLTHSWHVITYDFGLILFLMCYENDKTWNRPYARSIALAHRQRKRHTFFYVHHSFHLTEYHHTQKHHQKHMSASRLHMSSSSRYVVEQMIKVIQRWCAFNHSDLISQTQRATQSEWQKKSIRCCCTIWI